MCCSLQSIFMFPLSFSSSSSLSSIPPSLDTISELERALSDISEDGAYSEDTTSPDSWILSTNPSYLSENHFTNPDHLTLITTHSHHMLNTSEHLETQEQVETRETAELLNWRSWFCLKQRIKYFYYLLCFFVVMGKKVHITTKVLAVFSKKILTANMFESAVKFKACVASFPDLITAKMSKLDTVKNYMAIKWAILAAYLTCYLPTRMINCLSTLPWFKTRLHLPALTSSTLAPVLYSLPPSMSSNHISNHLSSYFLLTRSSLSPAALTTSLHQYLLNPSPFFLPILLVVFLLVVMLTASQSLVLALILATPLGLTLFYMESVIPRQRRAVLPMFMTENAIEYFESPYRSGLNMQESPTHMSKQQTIWTQDMCDPAA